MALDDKQNSPFYYIKVKDSEGTEHTLKIPVPKKPEGWETMDPILLRQEEPKLRKLAEDIDRAVQASLRENWSEEDFIQPMRLIFRRLVKMLRKTPIYRFAIDWCCEKSVCRRVDLSRVRHRCDVIRAWLLFLGEPTYKKSVTLLKPHHFNQYVRGIREADCSTDKANEAVRVLKSLARAIEPSGYLGKDLEEEVSVVRKRRRLKLEVLETIMHFLRTQGEVGEQWRTVIMIVLYTPIRPGAACSLRIDDINLKHPDGRIPYIDKDKTIKITSIPRVLREHLTPVIARIKREGRGPWLTPDLKHSEPGKRTQQFRNIMEAIGQKPGKLTPTQGTPYYETCLYDLRHIFMGIVWGLTQSPEKTRKYTNHATMKGTVPYLHDEDEFVLAQQRKLLDMAPNILNPKK